MIIAEVDMLSLVATLLWTTFTCGRDFFEVTRAGWIQDVIDKDVATVAIGPKVNLIGRTSSGYRIQSEGAGPPLGLSVPKTSLKKSRLDPKPTDYAANRVERRTVGQSGDGHPKVLVGPIC